MSDVEELSYGQCRSLLAGGVFGRVAVCTPDGPRIFPVNYSVVGETILFRTSPHGVVASHDWRSFIAFEVDHVDYAEQRGWSVLAVGPGERVDNDEDLDLIKRTWDPRPWASGSRPLYIRLQWTEPRAEGWAAAGPTRTSLPVRRQV